jgi:hypothetical protein
MGEEEDEKIPSPNDKMGEDKIVHFKRKCWVKREEKVIASAGGRLFLEVIIKWRCVGEGGDWTEEETGIFDDDEDDQQKAPLLPTTTDAMEKRRYKSHGNSPQLPLQQKATQPNQYTII